MDLRDIDLMSYLSALGEELKINELKDRVKIQKLVLIGQCAGVDIGNYNFNLYHLGPYSPQLADRYYSAQVAINVGDRSYEEYKLNRGDCESLDRIKPLLKPPEGIGLDEYEWLEVIATVIFVYNKTKSWEQAEKITKIHKRSLLSKSKLKLPDIIESIKKTKAFH
ncbi:hypothetical protein J2128_000540 [Methanomicrobium sp. W14]|uniref:hypothetical protein n=1 Tax=Methanomicrobium sp. W14 TaxID=2817839 RepID=UPI001AE25A0A|nr:hypothetical protein [Methanomicrobium sp. W14]MBP2132619.1 hypothetical protein [Methanomicrobium sp. W14]